MGQYWYPYEVIELGSHLLSPGHEREFVVCTLLARTAVSSGWDTATNLETKLADRVLDYDKLMPAFRELVLAAYTEALPAYNIGLPLKIKRL